MSKHEIVVTVELEDYARHAQLRRVREIADTIQSVVNIAFSSDEQGAEPPFVTSITVGPKDG